MLQSDAAFKASFVNQTSEFCIELQKHNILN